MTEPNKPIWPKPEDPKLRVRPCWWCKRLTDRILDLEWDDIPCCSMACDVEYFRGLDYHEERGS